MQLECITLDAIRKYTGCLFQGAEQSGVHCTRQADRRHSIHVSDESDE